MRGRPWSLHMIEVEAGEASEADSGPEIDADVAAAPRRGGRQARPRREKGHAILYVVSTTTANARWAAAFRRTNMAGVDMGASQMVLMGALLARWSLRPPDFAATSDSSAFMMSAARHACHAEQTRAWLFYAVEAVAALDAPQPLLDVALHNIAEAVGGTDVPIVVQEWSDLGVRPPNEVFQVTPAQAHALFHDGWDCLHAVCLNSRVNPRLLLRSGPSRHEMKNFIRAQPALARCDDEHHANPQPGSISRRRRKVHPLGRSFLLFVFKCRVERVGGWGD